MPAHRYAAREKNCCDPAVLRGFLRRSSAGCRFAGAVRRTVQPGVYRHFYPAQSLETVITAVQDARSRGADMLHLLLVGDGMSRAALEAKVKDLHAEDAVTFYGSVPATDIPKFTALADAFDRLPVGFAGLGADRTGQGCQLYGRRQAGPGQYGRCRQCGGCRGGRVKFPACDAAALADNLLALTRMDAAQRAAMGQSAKEYYLAHYRRSELLRKLEHFILEGRV